MLQVPKTHPRRTFIDMHTSTGADAYPNVDDAAMFAKTLYSAVWAHLVSRGFITFDQAGAVTAAPRVVFGETNPVDNAGCSPFTYQHADAHLNGTSSAPGGLVGSDLWKIQQNIVMRSWHDTVFGNEQCMPSPNVLNPPYVVQ